MPDSAQIRNRLIWSGCSFVLGALFMLALTKAPGNGPRERDPATAAGGPAGYAAVSGLDASRGAEPGPAEEVAAGPEEKVTAGPMETGAPAMVESTEILVAAGSKWRYVDDGADWGVLWRAPDTDDGIWPLGAAPLGYGEEDIATLVKSGPRNDRHPTTYFRRTFTVTDAIAVEELKLRLRRDDGAVVYLNGREILRDNMPDGPVDYRTFALGATGDEKAFHEFEVSTEHLVDGRNVMGVEIHQAAATSSDIAFDLELAATVRRPRS